MAFGDIGGAVTELVITCSTPKEGDVSIEKGDALCITGDYEVTNDCNSTTPVFGQAFTSTDENRKAIPVKVRGICIFRYGGTTPVVNGEQGVWMHYGGAVEAPLFENVGRGITVKVDEEKKEVHVLL